MFVLDTNILSAMMAANPAPEVTAFVSGQPADLLFTASICQAEILSGIAIMPEGRRRLDLEAAARAMFLEDFERRVLPFDMEAAIAYADIFVARRWAGRPEVLEQPIFVIHEADEYRRNTVFSCRPNRVDREKAPAIPNEAHRGLTDRKADTDAERHGPAEPSATRREVDIPKSKSNGQVLHDRIFR
jgi:predicted nucleic acid-binding protein